MKKIIIAAIAVLILASFFMPISLYPLNRLILNIAGDRLDAKINCSSLKINIWRYIAADNIEVVGKGGFGLTAEKLRVDYDLTSLVTGRLHLSCNLGNIKFYRSGTIMSSVSDMLNIRPIGNRAFENASAELFVGKNDTITQDLFLIGDDVKIAGDAVTGKDDTIICLLRFFLNDSITEEIPEELRGSLLNKEDGPWSSIHIGIMGNYEKPRLRIITDRFKMNISTA